MYYKNDGLTEDNRLQNQFTAFLNTALCNSRKAYLRGNYRRCKRELVADDLAALCMSEDDYIASLADYADLYAALHFIKERERRVFLSRVLDEKGFDEIAQELGISYKGAAAIYYRTIAKLRVLLGGEEK